MGRYLLGVSVGQAPAQRKRSGNANGSATEMRRKRDGNVDGNVAETQRKSNGNVNDGNATETSRGFPGPTKHTYIYIYIYMFNYQSNEFNILLNSGHTINPKRKR